MQDPEQDNNPSEIWDEDTAPHPVIKRIQPSRLGPKQEPPVLPDLFDTPNPQIVGSPASDTRRIHLPLDIPGLPRSPATPDDKEALPKVGDNGITRVRQRRTSRQLAVTVVAGLAGISCLLVGATILINPAFRDTMIHHIPSLPPFPWNAAQPTSAPIEIHDSSSGFHGVPANYGETPNSDWEYAVALGIVLVGAVVFITYKIVRSVRRGMRSKKSVVAEEPKTQPVPDQQPLQVFPTVVGSETRDSNNAENQALREQGTIPMSKDHKNKSQVIRVPTDDNLMNSDIDWDGFEEEMPLSPFTIRVPIDNSPQQEPIMPIDSSQASSQIRVEPQSLQAGSTPLITNIDNVSRPLEEDEEDEDLLELEREIFGRDLLAEREKRNNERARLANILRKRGSGKTSVSSEMTNAQKDLASWIGDTANRIKSGDSINRRGIGDPIRTISVISELFSQNVSFPIGFKGKFEEVDKNIREWVRHYDREMNNLTYGQNPKISRAWAETKTFILDALAYALSSRDKA